MKNARFALALAAFLVFPNVAWSVCTPTVQWIWDGDIQSPSFPSTCMTPVVVQLTNDNGDLRILNGTIKSLWKSGDKR